uniref:Uncharacterized protein n=1 Tax=Romanomermis culicivorax TaxID=13658 RepID=A0A915HY61_ROMCU
MDPSMSYASLTRQRDKKRRLNILRDFLEHLSKGDATTDIGKLLGDFLLDNPPIAQHIFQNFHNGIPFCLSASDSLDFKLALGLSWNDYRKIKCFMTKLNFDFLAPTNKAIVETSNRKVKSDLKFTYILLTEKDEKVERPLLVVSNLIDFIEECWADTIKNGELAEDDPRFEKKVWIAIGGDNGGKTTKLTLSIINVMKPNSVHNTRIIGFYEGADKADNIRTAFTHLSDQVRQIQDTMTLPYPLADGVLEQRKIKLFLVGDTMFLSYFNGHQGPSSSYPCLFCLIQLGLFNDIFKQIRILCKKIDLTNKFNLDLGTSKDVMSKEMSIPALTSAILTRIQELSNEIKFLEEDLDVYKRLKAMLTTCIDNKQHCNNWLYCKKCPNMTHMVCALVLTQHQMSLIKPDDFECFECKGQNNLSCILQTCNNIEETLKNNLVSLKRSYNENSTHADKLTENLERSQGSCEKELFSALDALGVDLKAYHSGSFVGNHIFRMLKIKEEINGPQLLTECLKSQSDHRKLFYDILVLLGEIFNLTTKTGFLSDVEINNISQLCRALKEMMIKKFPDWTTTVKLHMLTDHVPNFVKKHQSCGSFSEQGIESLHAQMNHIRRFFVMRGPSKYMPLIFQHHHLLASVKDSQRFLPKKRISTKSTCDNFDDQITCDNPAVEDRLSDDDFEVEY